MLSLHDELGSGKRQSVHNTDEALVWGHMEDCDADRKEAC